MQKRALKKITVSLFIFTITLSLAPASTAMGGTELVINGNFIDMTGWSNWPMYSDHGTYVNFWWRALNDWSTHGYVYQKVGTVTVSGAQYDASAELTHRLYSNQFTGTTNYNCDVSLVLADSSLDPTTDYLRGYSNGSGITQNTFATTVIFLNHNLTLNASSPLTGGSTAGAGLWDPETNYAGSYTTVAGDIGKDIYVVVSADIDTVPNDSGLQSGAAIVSLIDTIEYPFGDINEDMSVDFLDVVEMIKDWLNCNSFDDLSCHPVSQTGSIINESELFQAGNSLGIVDTRLGKIGIMICYDGYFAEVPRSLVLGGSDFIIWPNRCGGLFSRHGFVAIRALENIIDVICIDGSEAGSSSPLIGRSIIADYKGQILSDFEGAEGTLYADIDQTLSREQRRKAVNLSAVYRVRRPELYSPITEAKNI